MAARHSQNSIRAPRTPGDCLSAAELAARLHEEVGRAERHHTALSCLLVSLLDVQQLAHVHGGDLPTQALAYLGSALGPELRRFDRVGYASEGELLVVLPGAHERHAEIVARRALGRLHAVKVEVDGRRHPLRISMGIAAWSDGVSAEQLLFQTRIAAQRESGGEQLDGTVAAEPRAGGGELPLVRRS